MPRFAANSSSSVAHADDPRRRLRWLLAGFIVACTGIFARLIALEIGSGDEYRAEAARPTVQRRVIPATRGRILSRDGTVLAADRPLIGIAVRYRYLEEPPDAHWLRATARSRLTPRERRQPQRVAEEEARVCEERDETQRRLAEHCGISLNEWQARCQRIQAHVSQLSDRVNSRRAARGAAADGDAATSEPSDDTWLSTTSRRLFKALFQANEDPPTTVIVTEELQEHVVFEGVSLDAVAEIEGNPDKYPGITVIHASQRVYPGGSSAAHLLGYVRAASAPIATDRRGQAGIERQYDALLRGQEGAAADRFDRRGRLQSTTITQAPAAGRDLVVTIDPALQRAAETLLDGALARRVSLKDDRAERASGGAVVVIDVHNGAVLAAASAPRFDPTAFATGDAAAINGYLADPGHPLFDRAVQMAIPPGSVFKTVTAIALLHDAAFDPQRPFVCQGYLNSPEGRRCLIYRRYGIGHGPVTLVDAVAQSCNVYFFHHASEMGLAPLLLWGQRTGFGERTGIDLPGEATGHLSDTLPAPASRSRQREDAESLAIGQGTLTATPLQIVRMMAAVANGGQLVTPHVVERLGLPASDADDAVSQADATAIDFAPPRPIVGLDSRKLEIVLEGLRRVVADPKGTGHATLALDDVEIAGKTGTAEAGDGQADHAWFAGYAPADAPRVAFVVVLEHAGDAAAIAGPVAKRLVERLHEMGYLRNAGRAH